MSQHGRPPGVTLANWDLGGEPSAWAYLHADELLASVEIPLARRPAALASAELASIARFPVEPGVSLERYVADGPVSGIVVVLGGTIVFERYPRMEPGDRHFLMSVAKAFTSAVTGILELRGSLDLASPVDAVIGELGGSGWAGVPLGDVLDMASGIDCREIDVPGGYDDPAHPFYRFEACLGWRPAYAGRLPSAYEFVAGLPSHRPPGEAYEYTGVNTFVLSWAAERVSGRTFGEVLGSEIWSRAGFEAPALLCGGPDGAPGSHGGLCATLRDLARFGMLFTPSGRLVADEPVISAEHVRRIQGGARAGLRRVFPAALPAYITAAYGARLPPAGRQWNFVMADGDFFKGGFGGQGLYVSPGRDLVIAFAGTPRADGSPNLLRWYSRRLACSVPVTRALPGYIRKVRPAADDHDEDAPRDLTAVPPEFRPACGRPGSRVIVRRVPVTIPHALCDLTGVHLSYPGHGGAAVTAPPGGVIWNSRGFRLEVDADTLDVTITVTGHENRSRA
jgi:CubicO group peptidase (beta-lactamase class C family)